MKRRLISGWVLATLSFMTAGGIHLIPVGADESEPHGCAGVTAYMKALRAVTVYLDFTDGRALWTPERNDGEDEGLLIAAQEWEEKASVAELQRIANYHQGYKDGLELITPPEWLRDWHALRLIEADLAVDYVTEGMAIGPVAAAHQYLDRFDALNTAMAAVQERIGAHCPTFRQQLHDNDLYGDSVASDRLTAPAASPEP